MESIAETPSLWDVLRRSRQLVGMIRHYERCAQRTVDASGHRLGSIDLLGTLETVRKAANDLKEELARHGFSETELPPPEKTQTRHLLIKMHEVRVGVMAQTECVVPRQVIPGLNTPDGMTRVVPLRMPDMSEQLRQVEETANRLEDTLHRIAADREAELAASKLATQKASVPPEYQDDDGEPLAAKRMAFLLDTTWSTFNRWVSGNVQCPYLRGEKWPDDGRKLQGVRSKLFLKSTLDRLLVLKREHETGN